jgi:hypothetical protein
MSLDRPIRGTEVALASSLGDFPPASVANTTIPDMRAFLPILLLGVRFCTMLVAHHRLSGRFFLWMLFRVPHKVSSGGPHPPIELT